MNKKISIKIPILANTYYDLSKFDFSFKEISIVKIDSEEFGNYIMSIDKRYSHENFPFMDEIRENHKHRRDKLYAVIKHKYNETYDYEDLYNVWKMLLIIFPSDLQMLYQLDFSDINGLIGWSMSSDTRIETGAHIVDKYLYSNDAFLEGVNKYLVLCFDNLKVKGYLGLLIDHYILSYRQMHKHLKFITLCICLECIISGEQELIYRIRRSVAIICGTEQFSCDLISNNVKKIYGLRSKIVHGERFDYQKLSDYLEYLRILVSVTIQELLMHNITSNKMLDEIITKLGYGDRNKISETWIECLPNLLSRSDLIKELNK